MYKNYLAVSDLDGTLLSDEKSLSAESIAAFRDLRELDIKTAIVTSRPKRLAEAFASELMCDAAAYNNGAEVYSRGELIYSSRLSGEFTEKFTADLVRNHPDILIGAEADGEFYANYNMISQWGDDVAIRCDFPKHPFSEASKLIIKAEHSSELAEIASYATDYDIHTELAHSTAIITTGEASKLRALKRIAKDLGVALEDVYAFGDDIGDLEILKAVGHPFCTENAHPMLKSYAEVCKSNDENGVAEALKKHILGGSAL